MAQNPIDYSLRLSHSSASRSLDGKSIYALIEIRGGNSDGKVPSDLSFLIDVSDSMRVRLVTEKQFSELVREGHAQEVMSDGVPAYQISSIGREKVAHIPRRIDYVKKALAMASGMLRDEDYFSLVAFAGQAKILISRRNGKERRELREAAESMDSLEMGDDTRLDLGLELVYDEISAAVDQEHAPRIIILTDGYTKNVDECYSWARKFLLEKMRITTMGIGTEFNEDLLIPLADLTGGNAYFIETPDKLGAVFEKEIGSAFGIGYRNMELKINLSPGLDLQHVYRVRPALGDFDQIIELDGSYSIQLGDYSPHSPISFLLELRAGNHGLEDRSTIKTMLAWDAPGKNFRNNLRREVQVKRTNSEDTTTNQRVLEIVNRVEAFKNGVQAIETARKAAEAGDSKQKTSATIQLRQAATRLLDLGEPALAGEMYQQADRLISNGGLDPASVKKLRYETRRLSQL